MKILSYILSPIFALVFFLILVIFHPLQWVSLRFFGSNAHEQVVATLNYFLVKSMLILGVKIKLKNAYKIPENIPLLFVANHQSTFDIPPLGLYFKKYHPKFVAKIELGKGLPSVSFNLKYGGSALIDRKDSKQAIGELVNFAKRIQKNNWSAIIFPEGTRSKTGKPKKFAQNGLKVLAKYNKNGYIIPITINNSWKVFRYGKFPLGLGSPITITTHKPLHINSMSFEDLFNKTEEVIKKHIQ